jgi:2-methylcitrate dehydratase PrpD
MSALQVFGYDQSRREKWATRPRRVSPEMRQSIVQAEPIARVLARFVTALAYENLPTEVLDRAKALVLDQLACELIGSTMPWVAPALNLVQLQKAPKPESTLVNDGKRVVAADAAFVNATYGHACEMDDAAYGSSGHIGTAVVPVAMALAERDKLSGRELLTAVVAGYEVMYRLMTAVTPHNITRGFQSQGIGGPFGAATAAGKILGLNPEEMTHALAIAGSHSSGPAEYDQSGGEVKRIHAGLGARAGVNSAMLAKFGLTGPPTIIEGRRGFCNIFAEQSDPARITAGLGDGFKIVNASFKMFPAVGGVHTVIAAVDRLVREYDLRPAQVDKVSIGLAEKRMLHGASITRPNDVASAQFSFAYSVALAICKRANQLADYMNPMLWGDAEMITVMDRVDAHPDAAAQGNKINRAAVVIRTKDGRKLEAVEDYPKGTPPNPATRDEHRAKVRSLCGTVLSPARIDQLIQMVEGLETVQDIGEVASLLVGEEGRAGRLRAS